MNEIKNRQFLRKISEFLIVNYIIYRYNSSTLRLLYIINVKYLYKFVSNRGPAVTNACTEAVRKNIKFEGDKWIPA